MHAATRLFAGVMGIEGMTACWVRRPAVKAEQFAKPAGGASAPVTLGYAAGARKRCNSETNRHQLRWDSRTR
jgi:hypothetical protein